MPEQEYDGLAIVDGDNIVSGVQRLVCKIIDIQKFTAFIREQLLRGSTREPLMIWCQTLLTSDPGFRDREIGLERHGWRVYTMSGTAETDEHTGRHRWSGMPDSFIAQEARKALAAYRIRRLLLASGDGYFIPLINQAKDHFVRTIVLSIRNALHHDLYAVANEVILIDEHLDEITGEYEPVLASTASWAKRAQMLDGRISRPLIGRRRRSHVHR